MNFYLAIDAGGTKTTCVVANDTSVLARAQGGTVKIMRTSEAQARMNLEALLAEVAECSGVSLRSITATCMGLAGVTIPHVARWADEALRELVGGRQLLCGDVEIALDAAFPDAPGVLVIAGTGSNVLGRRCDGSLIQVGGYGPAIADEGSGHWIGQLAIRSAFTAYDARESTILLDAIVAHWQCGDYDQLVAKANAMPPPDFSQLVPVVCRCAEQGDALAPTLLRHAGEELARLVLIAVRRQRLTQSLEQETPQVAYTGSILEKVTAVREAMIATLRKTLGAVDILPEAVDPVQGALFRARQLEL